MASDVTKLIDLTSSEVPVQAEMPPVLAMEILFPIRFLTPIWRPMLRMEQHKLYSMVKKKKKAKQKMERQGYNSKINFAIYFGWRDTKYGGELR